MPSSPQSGKTTKNKPQTNTSRTPFFNKSVGPSSNQLGAGSLTKTEGTSTRAGSQAIARPPRCYKCQGLGHYAPCPNTQLVTFVDEPKYDDDGGEAEEPTQGEPEIVYPDRGESLVVQHVLSVVIDKTRDDTLWLRHNIFRTKCTAKGKVCSIIIDDGSCEKMVATTMVEKLGLLVENHPEPYQLTWLKKGNIVSVTKRCLVHFSIGNKYTDEVWCEVIPMDACHILLGRPWQYDRRTKHDGFHNTYSFKKDGISIVLAPQDTRQSATEAMILSRGEFINYSRLHEQQFLFALFVTEQNAGNHNTPT